MPFGQELPHLLIVKVFQGGMEELRMAQPVGLVTYDPRGDLHPRLRMTRGKSRDLVDYRSARGRVEYFIQPIQVKRGLARRQALLHLFCVQPIGNAARFAMLEKARSFPRILFQIDPERQRSSILSNPAHGKIFQERRLAGARIS